MTSLYQQTVPVFTKYLKNLSVILGKGEQWAKQNGKTDEESSTRANLVDIGACVPTASRDEKRGFHACPCKIVRLTYVKRKLPYQIQSCCNTIKFMLPRIGGLEDRHFPDDEKTFDELQSRITTTIDLLASVPEDAFAGKENEQVLMESKIGTFKFTGQSYVSEFTLPNYHFHQASAYCILRHLGVDVGAMDYLGKETFVKLD
ncbi:hypothetical protein LTS10_005204 [Elasticomyces elasticus]|nr:hypothetical protein LTS10_005204 [Elasticomyces elasticus]